VQVKNKIGKVQLKNKVGKAQIAQVFSKI